MLYCAFKLVDNLVLSNLGSYVSFALNLSSNLQKTWELSDNKDRERIQYMLFPEGIYYDRKNDNYRTERVNIIFDLINSITGNGSEEERGQTNREINLSPSVPTVRLELTRI